MGAVFNELDTPHLWPALLAWVGSRCNVVDEHGVPAISDFCERYYGQWKSWRDFAAEERVQIVDMSGWDELAQCYFNYDSFFNDLWFDYSCADASEFGEG